MKILTASEYFGLYNRESGWTQPEYELGSIGTRVALGGGRLCELATVSHPELRLDGVEAAVWVEHDGTGENAQPCDAP